MAKETVEFGSSNIQSADYDTETGMMTVTFNRGGVYQSHRAVPAELWREFKVAPSAGGFFHANLKGSYV